MQLRYKFVIILLLFLAIIYVNYPNVWELIPSLRQDEAGFYQEKEKNIQIALNDLKELQLFLVEKEKGRIQAIGTSAAFLQSLAKQPLISGFFEDFKIKEEEGKTYLYLTNSKAKITELADQFNRLALNSQKIDEVQYQADKQQLFFLLQENQQLSPISEPIKTFLADELDWVYDAALGGYSSRKKKSDLLISLGLDLKGGIYLDLSINTEELFENLLKNLREDLNVYFSENGIFVLDMRVIDERNLEIRLDPSQEVDWQGDKLSSYLSNTNIQPQGEGVFLATLGSAEINKIKEKTLEQVINTLNNRIDQLGVKEPSIQKKGDDSVIVQLPGQTDPARARRIIQQSAKLEFRFVVENLEPENAGNNLVLISEVKDEKTGEVLGTNQVVVEDRVVLGGELIREARVSFSQNTGLPYVTLVFNSKGATAFGEITEKNVGRRLAVILDNKVQSSPVIQEAIYGGNAQISGSFTNKEASDLALVLRSGSLPTSLIINQERTVGASLGEDSVRNSMLALAFGFLLIILLILGYYRISGAFCIVALVFNILFIFAALSYFEATLTLPGMAGIILTVGMAVDANILIFERIKEELKKIPSSQAAIQRGFELSRWTILDANITTLLAAGILFYFGTGPIKGFSITLSIGILASLFTSLFVTRFLFEVFYLRSFKAKKVSI